MAALARCRNRQFHAFGWNLCGYATRAYVIPGGTRDPAFLHQAQRERAPSEFTNEVQHLTQVLRCRPITSSRLRNDVRQIAAALDREASTIARELKRNMGAKIGYQPAYAQAKASARRWSGARLEREDTVREPIPDRLAKGWSPEQVAGCLAHEAGRKVISQETIYRFVYVQLKRTMSATQG